MFSPNQTTSNLDHLAAPGSMYMSESLELREMFRLHPNVKIFAHGHLHYTYGTKDDFGRGGYFAEEGLLHISVGGTANNKGSSFLSLEKDKITVRVRDHKNQQWVNKYQYILDIPTTLTLEDTLDQDAVWDSINKKIHNE